MHKEKKWSVKLAFALLLVAGLVLQGCSNEPVHPFFVRFSPWGVEEHVNATAQAEKPNATSTATEKAELEGAIKPAPPPKPHPRPKTEVEELKGKPMPVVFNFDHADIREVIKVFLKDILKVNYMVDNAVKGSVTLHTEGTLRPDQVMDALRHALDPPPSPP